MKTTEPERYGAVEKCRAVLAGGRNGRKRRCCAGSWGERRALLAVAGPGAFGILEALEPRGTQAGTEDRPAGADQAAAGAQGAGAGVGNAGPERALAGPAGAQQSGAASAGSQCGA